MSRAFADASRPSPKRKSAELQLVGQDATRIDHLWQTLFRDTFWRGGPVLVSAIGAIDVALWHLNAKALGVPVHRLVEA